MKTSLLITLIMCCYFLGSSQKKSSIQMSAYADTYYASFSNDIPSSEFQTYSTTSARNKSIGVNIAQLGFSYTNSDIRTNITIHYGDIPQATWSSDFNFLQEANVGVQLFKDWWLDLGFFRTHLGTESFLPKNNDLTSTSIITYNEPFYQGGAKLAYEGSEKFDLEFWVINGYNQFRDINSSKSVGILATYNFTENTSICYTNLFGDESQKELYPDLNMYRTYHNLYLNTQYKKLLKLSIGADFSTQSETVEFANLDNYFSFLSTLRLFVTKKLSVTGRYEYFSDPSGFIGGVNVNENDEISGSSISGITGGVEYKPTENSFMRVEMRNLRSLGDFITPFSNGEENRNEFIINMGCYFDKKW